MSKENAKLFFKKVQADGELQEQIKELGTNNQSNVEAKLIELAAEQGFNFSEEDLRQLREKTVDTLKKDDELDDSQLEAVAGGGTAAWIVNSIFVLTCITSGIGKGLHEVDENYFHCALDD